MESDGRLVVEQLERLSVADAATPSNQVTSRSVACPGKLASAAPF
jgi:hypothetical protein